MRRLLLATFLAGLVVVAALLAYLALASWGLRYVRPEPIAVLGQVASSAMQFQAARGCLPRVPAALFESQVAAAPQAQFDCTDEQARVPLSRPYMAQHRYDPRTGDLLVQVRGGVNARVSLGYESSPAGRLRFVRIQGLPPEVARRALAECNTSAATEGVEFVGKCRSPFPGALDLRFEPAARAGGAMVRR